MKFIQKHQARTKALKTFNETMNVLFENHSFSFLNRLGYKVNLRGTQIDDLKSVTSIQSKLYESLKTRIEQSINFPDGFMKYSRDELQANISFLNTINELFNTIDIINSEYKKFEQEFVEKYQFISSSQENRRKLVADYVFMIQTKKGWKFSRVEIYNTKNEVFGIFESGESDNYRLESYESKLNKCEYVNLIFR